MRPYTLSIEIELPRDEVVRKFQQAENLFHWQNGLQSVEQLSGQTGIPGCLTKLVYQQGRHRIELMETVVSNELPDKFCGFYSWAEGENTLESRFLELEGGRTRWESTCSYKMKSLTMKLMGFFFRGKFVEQNQKFLDNFKAFCENGSSVREQV